MKLSAVSPHLTGTIKVSDTETLTFQFKQPTVADWRKFDSIEKDGEKDATVKELALLVTDTGLEHDDGTKIEPTEDAFREIIPAAIAGRMLSAIVESLGNHEKKLSSSSKDGSEKAEDSAGQSRKSKSTN